MSKTLCFRPTETVHDSGYLYIEYGYMDSDGKVKIVARYDVLVTPYDIPMPFNLDLTKSGWFRILPRKEQELAWEFGGTIKIKKGSKATNDPK